jgi:hypothetical protein
MKIILLKEAISVIILSLLLFGCNSNKTTRILFIGNSLTYYNDMPKKLGEALNESGAKFIIVDCSKPGANLCTHAEDSLVTDKDSRLYGSGVRAIGPTATEKLIADSLWDYIVFQEEPMHLIVDSARILGTENYLPQLIALNKNKNAQLIWFLPSSDNKNINGKICFHGAEIRKDLEYKTKYCGKSYSSADEYLRDLEKQNEVLAAKYNLALANPNPLFRKLESTMPTDSLVDPYGHPTLEGTYANACYFYEFFTGKQKKLDCKRFEVSEKFAGDVAKYQAVLSRH